MIYVSKAILYLRGKLGITQREMAKQLQISYVLLSNLENDKAKPTRKVLDKFRAKWGVDLYVFSWSMDQGLPKSLRAPAQRVRKEWARYIEVKISHERSKEG